ncbi:putative multidomain presynaptic cytomatrix related protein [Rosellinia necatrix]|uniref:Putative multidomain presynaptic cytomatrix related protein n=1 Tax=Rosellinia necatrix TaxID=77044 RepID=A0A1W2TGB0_ROSNE|nr:putative multidomain presynaptic cytomatrix related protein [Rosellinia necatrix]
MEHCIKALKDGDRLERYASSIGISPRPPHTLTSSSAAKFQVTVDFLLQQVAWLTERHASQVRAQMRKAAAAAKISPAPSPQPQAPEGGFPMDPPRYTGPVAPRAPSSASIRKDSPLPRNEQNAPNSSMRSTPRPHPTRSSSNNVVFSTTRTPSGGTKGSGKSGDAQRHRFTSLPITTNIDDPDDVDNREVYSQSPGPVESSSATSSSSSSPAQSRIIRRPPRFQSNEGTTFADDDDDDDVEPVFLPYRPQTGSSSNDQTDLNATLRGDLREQGKRSSKGPIRDRTHHSQTSDSSTGSVPISRAAAGKRPSGPLSPRRTMEQATRSPSSKPKAYSRDSDGTPSMSSSFSDLDDASVTQSALEEVLASRMQDGGTIGSLRGTISNVFRSRY